jgi:hypothetical protein
MNLLLLAATEIAAPELAEVALARYPARAGWWPPAARAPLLVGLRDGALGEGVVEHSAKRLVRASASRSIERPRPRCR